MNHDLSKESVARALAIAHQAMETTISAIYWLKPPIGEEGEGPITLLEVNSATPACGIVPITFTADPPEIPYPSIVIEVSPEEFDQLAAGQLSLPEDLRKAELRELWARPR